MCATKGIDDLGDEQSIGDSLARVLGSPLLTLIDEELVQTIPVAKQRTSVPNMRQFFLAKLFIVGALFAETQSVNVEQDATI